MANIGVAQLDSLPQKKAEVFLNISNSLARFTGNEADNAFLDAPFLVGFKIRSNNNRRAFRLGLDFNINNTSGFENNLTTETSEQYYVANAGYEWRRSSLNKFEFYYGADLRYYNLTRETNSEIFDPFTGTSTSQFFTRNNGPGAGLFLGFVWNITPRISVFTEGSLAYYAINNYREVKELNSTTKTVLEDKLVHQFSPLAPNSLFFLFKF
jgi:hypothetical protein